MKPLSRCLLSVSLTLTLFTWNAEAGESVIPSVGTGTPVLDGKIDAVWNGAVAVEVTKPIDGLLEIDQDLMATAKVRLLWDKEYLYTLWEVTDAVLGAEGNDPWSDDSVEVFVDRNHAKTSVYENDDAQYRISYKGYKSGQGTGYAEEDFKGAVAQTKTGYIVEMAIKLNEAAEIKEDGRKIGLELQVNDDHGAGYRQAVAKWNYTEDSSWEDTSNFGTINLVPTKK